MISFDWILVGYIGRGFWGYWGNFKFRVLD